MPKREPVLRSITQETGSSRWRRNPSRIAGRTRCGGIREAQPHHVGGVCCAKPEDDILIELAMARSAVGVGAAIPGALERIHVAAQAGSTIRTHREIAGLANLSWRAEWRNTIENARIHEFTLRSIGHTPTVVHRVAIARSPALHCAVRPQARRQTIKSRARRPRSAFGRRRQNCPDAIADAINILRTVSHLLATTRLQTSRASRRNNWSIALRWLLCRGTIHQQFAIVLQVRTPGGPGQK